MCGVSYPERYYRCNVIVCWYRHKIHFNSLSIIRNYDYWEHLSKRTSMNLAWIALIVIFFLTKFYNQSFALLFTIISIELGFDFCSRPPLKILNFFYILNLTSFSPNIFFFFNFFFQHTCKTKFGYGCFRGAYFTY